MRQRLRIEVRGIVQGVGFRPYIYRLAQQFRLGGAVYNSQAGVVIEIQGAPQDIASFLHALPLEAPPLARLLEINTTEMALQSESEFSIVTSERSSPANTLIAPDIATCDDCLRELFDPTNRRYLYPFINCINCGPRFTIVRRVPYDREHTSMASFKMCAHCQAEYDDPLDRRFHAQPNACYACGPMLQLLNKDGVLHDGDPVAKAIQWLQNCAILAVKGLGGFHLATDACQPNAVEELRRRKHRGEKPFAVMVRDLAAAQEFCTVTNDEALLLQSPQRPIVLLAKRSALFDSLAPDGNQLGLFLPYTPLHHLLLATSSLRALVMTSANLSEEPIAIDNQEALTRLRGIADFFLVHNREILLRCDDSVTRSLSGRTQFVRRSRGYVPSPVILRDTQPCVLAVGGELKNTICLSRGRYAFPGQHIGDLENLSAYSFFQESISHFQQILEVTPEIIAHDLHPAYLATRWAKSQNHLRILGIQHHHAHIASCMAENHLVGPVIGIALDGTGYGTDGHAWGCEVLVADLRGFERAAHLQYVPMPGAGQAIHEPWRMAVSYLWQTFGKDWQSHASPSFLSKIPPSSLTIIEQILTSGAHAPLTSSCGRLFDAVAALVCNRTTVTYEAQAAIALEACCDPAANPGAYPFSISERDTCLQIDPRPLFMALAQDLRKAVPTNIISRRFHSGLVDALSEASLKIAKKTGLRQVCLSGGSFQNAFLSIGLEQSLTRLGLNVFVHKQVPPGDGGLSLGQLVIAANQ